MKRTKAATTSVTPILDLAARLADVSRRRDSLNQISLTAEGETPEFKERNELLLSELEFVKEHILNATPRTLSDAAVQIMVSTSALLSVDDDEANGMRDRLSMMLARVLRVVADAAGLDLRTIAAQDFIVEDEELEIFPELSAAAA